MIPLSSRAWETDTAKQGDMERQRGTEGGDRAGCVSKGHWTPKSQTAEDRVCGTGGGDSRASQHGPFHMGAEQLWGDWLLPPQHAHTGTDTRTPVTNRQQLNRQEACDASERRKSPLYQLCPACSGLTAFRWLRVFTLTCFPLQSGRVGGLGPSYPPSD